MELGPIFSALRRNKVGAGVIAVQMAITLAIVCNSLFIIQQRAALSQRPSGADEPSIFVITNQWVGNPPDLAAKLQADLAALRSLSGVVDAYVSNTYPLSGGGSAQGVSLHAGQEHATALGAVYLGDDHSLATLGLKLIAGRNFTAAEVADRLPAEIPAPAALIITRKLADIMFPAGNALGKSVYLEFQRAQTPIVGIVDTLQGPWTQANGFGSKFSESSMIEPLRFVASYSYYLVRSRPGQLTAVMQAAQKALVDLDRARVLEQVQPLSAARMQAYRDDRGLVVILGAVCVALLAVTAFGIVGLTSYWVAQRRRQIGIRRALGATRGVIVRHFQIENLVIAAIGAATGVALAIALNLWMVRSFEMPRLQAGYALAGAAIVLLLGQLAVLWPALRAAAVSPALAARGV
jgi:putative ABC transport system permease protein